MRRNGCTHWLILAPDRFLRMVARHGANGPRKGFVYLCRGRCKLCEKEKSWERISWMAGYAPKELALHRPPEVSRPPGSPEDGPERSQHGPRPKWPTGKDIGIGPAPVDSNRDMALGDEDQALAVDLRDTGRGDLVETGEEPDPQ